MTVEALDGIPFIDEDNLSCCGFTQCSNSFSTKSGKEGEMDPRHTHSPNTAHRSLQRPAKGELSCGGEEARVVWLGRSGDCFVAGSPLYTTAHRHLPSPHQPYQLSSEFQQRQVAAIERKYGGTRRAHNAALVIQRAYRKYGLAKKWAQVRNPSRRRVRLNDPPEGGVMKTSSGTLVRMPPQSDPAAPIRVNIPYTSVAPHLKLHRYPLGRSQEGVQVTSPRECDRRGSSPLPSQQALSRVQVRVSQSSQAHYYQAGHLHRNAAPPGVRVQTNSGMRSNRSSSAERNHAVRIVRQPASSPALRSQGANADLRSPHYSYHMLLQQQQMMYERRLDLACPEDPVGAFPSPAGKEEDPWTRSNTYLHSGQIASPAPSRRGIGHQLSLPNFEPESPSSTSTDSTPSSHGPDSARSPRLSRNSNSSTGRLVTGPVRRTSESPITVIRTASAASTASTASSGSRAVESRGIRCCQPGPSGSTAALSAGPAQEKDRELRRKRQYRIALNFFNKKPERGMELLVRWGFTEGDPGAVAKFLLTRRGLSKQMIGDYLGQINNHFAQAVLHCFVEQVGMGGLKMDEALRHFLTLFRLPGEAQKIERIIQVFAEHYCNQNREAVSRVFRDPETVFILAFAVIMLNTDLHTPNLKDDKRMKINDFFKNLRAIDAGEDIDREYLRGIYERVKENEFRPGSDHLTQVLRVDRSVLPNPKKPTLPLPHRRLVCYCRLYEVDDPGKKQAASVHQRELFLFNDLLVVTKMMGKGKRGSTVSYSFRQSHSLVGLSVHGFRNQYYQYGLRLNLTQEGKTLHFHARSEDDRSKFMEDLREATLESEEMEALRIDMELEKQALIRPPNTHSLNRSDAQRDSGLPELEGDRPLRHRALSSSTLELSGIADPAPPLPRHQHQQPERRLSLNSDSGMSSTASVASRESSPKAAALPS